MMHKIRVWTYSLVSVILLTLSEPPAKPDVVSSLLPDGTEFYSRKRTAKAILANDGTEYQVSSSGQVRYKIKVESAKQNPRKPLDLWFANGTAYLSDDGDTLVWLLSRSFTGHLKLEWVETKTGKLKYICPSDKLARNLNQPALAVFKHGKLLVTYSLKTLLVRPVLVNETAENTNWIRPSNDDIAHCLRKDDPALSKDGKLFSFETTSFRKYKIDTQNGKITEASDIEFWKKANIILWGKFTKSTKQKDILTIESITLLKGKGTPGKITVHDRTGSYYGSDYYLPFWTGASLQKRGERYEIVAPLWNFPMHVEPW